MTCALAHRGPDDEGFFDDDPVSFGFRRLAVIDLETGEQPIELPERRLAIILNGEIYNYRDLRQELAAIGHRFRSTGDVEVVLRLWAEQGPQCLHRLNGMFALAVWDGELQRLYLARDRFGIKPLYVWSEGGSLAFASELCSLREGGFPSSPRLDPLQLRHYLSYGFLSPIGAPDTRIQSVAPATLVEIDGDGHRQYTRYWSPSEGATARETVGEPVEDLREILDRAVERQLVADVPVGVFLSGGLDSSTLCAIARRHVSGRLQTFSVGFEGPDAVSELPEARQVAEFLQSDHHELMMDPAAVVRDVESIVDSLDAPLADPTSLPTWYMSRLARKHVTVALSGEGADEIFGGYARQRFDVAIDRIGWLGRLVLPVAMRLAGSSPSERLLSRLRMRRGLGRQLDWGRVFSEREVDGLLANPEPFDGDTLQVYKDLAERWLVLSSIDPVNTRLMTDREVFLPGDLLPKVDRMSMAHSLEVRVPYLDNEVANYVVGIPGRFKQSFRYDKILLRKAAASYLPAAASRRRKRGFMVPIGNWLRGALRPLLTDWLSPDAIAKAGLFEPRIVSELVDEHLREDRDRGQELWTLLVISRWLETSGTK
jgi:asparagine synthase (glutamine-hydrolysing)